ncbi:MAG: MarR family transcriptional regulator [bacterium]|nr:MarR family transcriptional regulator [bacterium]
MTNKNEELNKRFFSILGQAFRKLTVLNKEQKTCYGLTIQQCATIETLGRKELLSMNDLSGQLGVSISTMTRVVDVLVRDGILERTNKPGDRRKVCISLTEKGEEMQKKLENCSLDLALKVLDSIPEEKRESVVEALELVNDAIGTVCTSICCKVIT